MSPGGSAIPLLMLCEPGFTVSSPVGPIACPSVGVVNPAGASVVDCCAMRIAEAAPMTAREKTAIFRCVNALCFNAFISLRQPLPWSGPGDQRVAEPRPSRSRFRHRAGIQMVDPAMGRNIPGESKYFQYLIWINLLCKREVTNLYFLQSPGIFPHRAQSVPI